MVAVAIERVRQGEVLSQVARNMNIPVQTLRDKYHNRHCGDNGRPTTLTRDEEQHLLSYINNMGQWGWPLTVPVIMVLAREVGERRPANNRLHKNFPTEKWWRGFRGRHRAELRTNIRPDKIDRGRASVCIEDVRSWWQMCHTNLEKLGVIQLPHRLYNVDETGYDRSITKVGT